MLSDANALEHKALDAVKYQPNEMVLHGDCSIMPKRRPPGRHGFIPKIKIVDPTVLI
jgi:predicted NAD/FAD-binding protein